MKNIKCPNCGLVNFAGAKECKRCQKAFDDAALLPTSPPQQFSQQPLLSDKVKEEKPWWYVRPIVLFAIFGTPLFYALQDKLAGKAKPGGYVEALDNWMLLFGGGGLLIRIIVLTVKNRS